MKKFTGMRDILARPMNRLDYNRYRGWELPADEDGSDEGFLVEYIDGGRANHPDHEGYISWSPKDVFERVYRPSGTFLDRIEIELADLRERLSKLEAFLSGSQVLNLDPVDRELLEQQAAAMKEYMNPLVQRRTRLAGNE